MLNDGVGSGYQWHNNNLRALEQAQRLRGKEEGVFLPIPWRSGKEEFSPSGKRNYRGRGKQPSSAVLFEVYVSSSAWLFRQRSRAAYSGIVARRNFPFFVVALFEIELFAALANGWCFAPCTQEFRRALARKPSSDSSGTSRLGEATAKFLRHLMLASSVPVRSSPSRWEAWGLEMKLWTLWQQFCLFCGMWSGWSLVTTEWPILEHTLSSKRYKAWLHSHI